MKIGGRLGGYSNSILKYSHYFSFLAQHPTGAGNPFVKVIYDKQKEKTQVFKNAEDAKWREIFYLYVQDLSPL